MQVEIAEIKLENPKVTQEMAMEEFQKWLDYKKTKVQLVKNTGSEEEGEESKANTAIVEAIMAGELVFNEDMSMTYLLNFPVKSETGSTELHSLTLKPRLTAFEVQKATKGISKDEPFKLFTGYIHILSGEVRGLVNKIDSTDFSLLQKIVGYFL
jgi:hypothetical protein